MDYLLEFGNRDSVRTLARTYLNHTDAVQGIAVDLDDVWLAAWRAYNSMPAGAFERDSRWFGEYFPGPYVVNLTASWFDRFPFSNDPFISYPYGVDPQWSPDVWKRMADWRNVNEDPFVLIVVLRSDFTTEGDKGLSREYMEGLRHVETGGIQVRFEPRPMARLYAGPKDKVRPVVGGLSVSSPQGAAGTLGGILATTDGDRFGLTCSHVLATSDEAHQPAPADNKARSDRIGTCVDQSVLTSHTPPLDPYDSSLNAIDAALIQLDPQIPSALEVMGIGTLAGIASKSHAHPESSVEMAGKEAGNRSLYIGSATLVHEFDHNGTKYGYCNLFELKRASRFHGVTGTLSPPVGPGDSGAWVLRAGANGAEWLGVVVAGDGPYGYAIPAEFVTEWVASGTSVGRVGVL